MLYFVALFCSPLALLLALKPFSALFNALLYIAGLIGLLLGGIGFVPGLLGILHACFVISNAQADRRARQYGVR